MYLAPSLGILLAAFYIVRVELAPLSKVPGPWYTKWTDLELVYHWINGSRPTYIHRLHERYGPVVRVGPSEVDVTDPMALKAIYAIKNEYPKTPWYLLLAGHGGHDVFNTPDIEIHRRQRRLLGGTMSESALKNYNTAIMSRVDYTITRMREEFNKQGAIDVCKWWLFMTTDIIGELTFGESFKTLEQGKKSGYTRDLELSGSLSAIRTIFSSAIPVLRYLPIPAIRQAFQSTKNMTKYAEDSLSRHHNLQASDPTRGRLTLFTKIVQAKDENKLSFDETRNNASAFIIAGSDTTANTLTYLVWSVCKRPAIKAKLMEELNTLPDDYNDHDLQKLSYLSYVIEETLRLHPVVPCGLPRAVPPSGASLGGRWLPGGTTVACQSYSMHRTPEAFPDAESFIPERWEKPTKEMKDVFMAFGLGSRVCLGMHLAYMELRLGVAKFFREFPAAQCSSKHGMSDEDMEPMLYFLTMPKGHRCLIDQGDAGN